MRANPSQQDSTRRPLDFNRVGRLPLSSYFLVPRQLMEFDMAVKPEINLKDELSEV